MRVAARSGEVDALEPPAADGRVETVRTEATTDADARQSSGCGQYCGDQPCSLAGNRRREIPRCEVHCNVVGGRASYHDDCQCGRYRSVLANDRYATRTGTSVQHSRTTTMVDVDRSGWVTATA